MGRPPFGLPLPIHKVLDLAISPDTTPRSAGGELGFFALSEKKSAREIGRFLNFLLVF